jgi:hypothetical protein
MKFYLRSIQAQVQKARHVVLTKGHIDRDTPTMAPTDVNLRDLSTWISFADCAPSTTVPNLLTDDEAAKLASVVVHTDWSGSPSPGVVACVVLSHAVYGSCEMDPIFYEPIRDGALADVSAVGEATAVIALAHSFPDIVRDAIVVVHTDNETFEARHRRGYKPGKDSPALDARLRDLSIIFTSLNARLIVLRVPGKQCLADLLTRKQVLLRAGRREEKLRKALSELAPSLSPSRRPLSLPPTPPWRSL